MVTAQQLVTVGGIPVHPLIVHAVVVLLPLAGLSSMLIAVRPAWRRRYGAVVAVLTVVAVGTVPVAQESGEQLKARLTAVVDNPLITEHAQRGATLLPFAIAFGVAVLALVVSGRLADRDTDRRWQRVTVACAVLVVLAAVTVIGLVVWIGHSGSVAVWGGIG